MARLQKMLRAVFIAFPLVLAACADPTAPTTASNTNELEPNSLLGLGSLNKHAVRWTAKHDESTHSVSGVIDARGGKLSIPESDFSITFAAGAVSTPTNITVISMSGDYVSYDMQPHGLKFKAPVQVTQGLRNTEAYFNLLMIPSLVGAYVSNDVPPDSDGSFVATELLPSITYLTRVLFGLLLPDRQVWDLKHFSRYMLASG